MADQSTKIVLTADDRTRAAFESAKAGISNLQGSAAALTGVLAAATAALAGLTVVAKFQDFVKGAAALDDLAEKTGASVEKLSALASVAKISGTNLESVEGGLIKFAKALNGADNESQKASQAFAALGLDPAKLRTQDTAEAFKTLADRLFEFRDDSSKTAAVLEILGKSGAQLLPYLKDLAETGDLQARVTAEQAAQAENLEKNLNRLFATKNAGFKEFSAAVLPTVDAFVKALLDAANGSQGLREKIKELTADGTLERWARATAQGVAFVVDAASNAVGALGVLLKSSQLLASGAELAFAKLATSNQSTAVRDVILNKIRKEKEDASAALGEATAKFLERPQFRDQLAAQFAKQDADRASGVKPEGKEGLNFRVTGKDKIDAARDALKGIDSFVENITQRLVGQTEGEFAQLRQRALDVFSKVKVSELDSGQLAKYREKLELVNKTIAELEQRDIDAGWAKALADSFKLAGDAAEKADDAFRSFALAQSQQRQDMEFELAMVGKLSTERSKLSALRKIDLDAQRAIAAIQDGAENRDERIASILAEAEAAKSSTGELFDQLRTKGRDAWLGLGLASREYFERVTNDAENMRMLLGDAFKGLEDAGVKFALTFKLSFKDAINSITADVARIAIRKNITAPLASGLGGLFGGGSGGGDVEALGAPGGSSGGDFFGLRKLLGFASGGRPPVGVPSIVGENGPELFVPDVSGVVVPNSQLGGGGVTVVQNISVDARSDRASIMLAMEQARQAAVNSIAGALARNGQKSIAGAMA